jgi:hypothetical protein
MKKREILLFLSIILAVSLVSASYVCSDGSAVIEDSDGVKLGERSSINGLGLGLVKTRVTVRSTVSVDLLLDAKRISLTNETRTEEVEFKSGNHIIEIFNATDETASFIIDGDNQPIDEKETKNIGSLTVFLIDAEKSDLGEIKADILVGVDKTNLSSDEDSKIIVNINGTKYLLWVFSASNDEAAIFVEKCKTGEILEIKANVTEDNKTESEANITSQNNQTSEKNATVEANNTTYKNNTTEKKGDKDSKNNTANIPCKKGAVKEGRYCNENGTFLIQNLTGDSCMHHYVCKSYNCKTWKCEKAGFLKRLWNRVEVIFNLDLQKNETSQKNNTADKKKETEKNNLKDKNDTANNQCKKGSVKNGKYCNENGIFLNQNLTGDPCMNHYECKSDNCKTGKCEKAGFLKGIWTWVKGLF